MLGSPETVRLTASALVAAALEHAHRQGWCRIGARAAREGWNEVLAFCPRNMPPHLCFRRSIIERADHLSKRLPLLDQLRADLDRID